MLAAPSFGKVPQARLATVVRTGFDERTVITMDSLAAGIPHGVHLTGAWLRTFAEECMPPNAEPLLLLARDEFSGAVVGALPLRIEHVRGTRFWTHRRLVPLARGPSDFFDVLAAPGWEERVCEAFADWLHQERAGWDLLDLDWLPANSSRWIYFREALARRGFRVRVASTQSFYVVDTSADFSTLEQNCYRKSLKDLRRRLKRMAEQYVTPRLAIVTREIIVLLPSLLCLYAKRRHEKGQNDYFGHPAHRRFFERVIAAYEERGWAEAAVLEGPHGRLWAGAMGWLLGGAWYLYLLVMDSELGAYAPGNMLVYELVKRCCEDPQIREFNFMRGEAPYKAQFATGKQLYHTARVENPWSVRLKLTRAATRLVAVRDAILR
jgi:CelD/BcsL family acetyltransferase involved in cellulose biosynthesis